jgi:hypothetical protein
LIALNLLNFVISLFLVLVFASFVDRALAREATQSEFGWIEICRYSHFANYYAFEENTLLSTVLFTFLGVEIATPIPVVCEAAQEINLHAIEILVDDFGGSGVDDVFNVLLDVKVSSLEDLAFTRREVDSRGAAQHSISLEEGKPILQCLGAFRVFFYDIFVHGR